MVRRFAARYSSRVEPEGALASIDIKGKAAVSSSAPDRESTSGWAWQVVIGFAVAVAVFLVGLVLLGRRRRD